MKVNEKVNALRAKMTENKIDAYVIPTCDFHGSEYVDDYFKTRQFISGFTGSAGTALITMDKALLWTDGRYFLQAAEQLDGSEFILMKSGESGVPTLYEYIKNNAKSIAFDGRCMPQNMARSIEAIEGINVISNVDFIDEIWMDRPPITSNPIWIYEEKYSGRSVSSKLSKIRQMMKEKNSDVLVITALDEVAWTLNMRGDDIEDSPVFLSFLIVTEREATLYVNRQALDEKSEQYLCDNNVIVRDYDDIYSGIKDIKKSVVWLSSETCNYNIYKTIEKQNTIVDMFTPALQLKAIKNETEIKGMKKAHLLDGVAMTKFIYWLKNVVGNETLDEVSLGNKLEEFRGAAESYIEPSFEPIVGYMDHGAIVHYSATEDSSYDIRPEGIVLIDSGGHYLEGTTDITRTISLGEVSDKMRHMYTLVLKGHLKLAAATFKKGCSGVALDYLARESLWAEGFDYNHGTGHGVGCLLNVHEAPNAFRYRIMDNSQQNPVLEPGMITSDEPGVYIENEFGIRIENLILCVEKETNAFGTFLGFENLTLVPYDEELIDYSMLTDREKKLLGEYNKILKKQLLPYLSDKEKEWLEIYCKSI